MAEPTAIRLTGLRLSAARQAAILLGALAALTAIRLVVAAVAPLAPDEAYYWVFSRALAPGYLDHPPMVALWIRAGTALAGDGAIGVRLLGPVSGVLGTLLLYDAANRLWPGRRAGATAAAFLNATLLLGVGTVIMTPDTPLLFFWTACLWTLARLLASGRPAWWLAIGLCAGLALVSKYTALLLWVGIALWLLWVPSLRRWWRSPFLWAGALLGALVFLPVVLWNAHHHWASFLRQGDRVESWHPARAAQFLGELIGGQLGLATPLLFCLFIAGVAWATRRAWRERDAATSLLCALTLPGAAVFLQHALGDRVQGNWPAILYPAAALAAAGLGAPGRAAAGLGAPGRGAVGPVAPGHVAPGVVRPGVAAPESEGRRWLRWRWPAVAFGLAFTAVAYIAAALVALPVPVRANPIAHQLGGWRHLAASVDAVRRDQATGCVAADDYGVAAELARTLPPGVTVLAVGPRWRLVRLPPPGRSAADCILLRRSNSGVPQGWDEVQKLGTMTRASHGAVLQRFALWRVAGPLPALPAAVLPR